jgi:hypothetical protein
MHSHLSCLHTGLPDTRSQPGLERVKRERKAVDFTPCASSPRWEFSSPTSASPSHHPQLVTTRQQSRLAPTPLASLGRHHRRGGRRQWRCQVFHSRLVERPDGCRKMALLFHPTTPTLPAATNSKVPVKPAGAAPTHRSTVAPLAECLLNRPRIAEKASVRSPCPPASAFHTLCPRLVARVP